VKLHCVLSDRRIDSSLAITSFIPNVTFGVEPIVMPDGSNIRKTVADIAHRLQEKLLLCREDDTKSFFSLIVVSAQITCTVKADSHIACRAHAVPMPCCSLIHTCHAAPLPFSDSVVSFVKVRVVAKNI
jgi:hypothetical protein